MKLSIHKNAALLGKAAGTLAANLIRNAIADRGTANIILATGTSQYETLTQLISEAGIDWSKVVMFHLDEYIGLPITSGASFRRYLQERFVEKVPGLKAVHLINGEAEPKAECDRLGALITNHPIDVALAGIGENGHLAFNDPPANFETNDPYIIVDLDEACRKQQLGEGWFPDLDPVPKQAISMSIAQILRSEHIVCSVPDRRKADAVRDCLGKPVSRSHPASALQLHPHCHFFLDEEAASLLSADTFLVLQHLQSIP